MEKAKPEKGWFRQTTLDAIEHELVETYMNGDEGWGRVVSMVAFHSSRIGRGMSEDEVFERLAPARRAFHSKILSALGQMDVDLALEDPE